jgi:ureidoacrylate peracid hydrolase
MQNAFASKGGTFDLAGLDISSAATAVRATASLAAVARGAGVLVVYLQMTYSPDLADGGDVESPNFQKELGLIMTRQRPELTGKLLVRGTWDWQIVEQLKPMAGDLVIEKPRYDGFTRTELAERLRGMGVRNLLFSGIATNICVESTARHAFFEEFWPILVEDAVKHAGPDFNQQATVWAFENVFGWVTRTEDVFATLATARAEAAE